MMFRFVGPKDQFGVRTRHVELGMSNSVYITQVDGLAFESVLVISVVLVSMRCKAERALDPAREFPSIDTHIAFQVS
jgi:uncharacterized protein YcsI (UPF0317 family)